MVDLPLIGMLEDMILFLLKGKVPRQARVPTIRPIRVPQTPHVTFRVHTGFPAHSNLYGAQNPIWIEVILSLLLLDLAVAS